MGFFDLHKPLEYKYKYIYYDPKKEAQKEREKRAADAKDENGEFKSTIRRGTFREMADKSKGGSRSKQNKQSNIRLIVIILILFLVFYLLVK